jgi:Ca-activated chloride channel family protein
MTRLAAFFSVAGALALAALLAVVSGRPELSAHLEPVDNRPPSTRSVTSSALTMTTRLGHPKVQKGQTRTTLAIDVVAPQLEGAPRLPVNLALVIDRSGSMSGEKIDHAKAAAQEVISALTEKDRLTIVHYGSDAVASESALVTAANAQRLRDFVSAIEDGGGTNISAGMELARRSLDLGRDAFTIHRVMLLSDGQPTEGITDPAALLGQASALRRAGLTVSAIGIGADFNEDLMEQLAERGSGGYAFLNRAEALTPVLRRDLGQAATLLARDVELIIKSSGSVRGLEVLGHRAERVGDALRISLSDLAAGQTERVVAELELIGSHVGEALSVANVELAFKEVRNDLREQRLSGSVTASVVASRNEVLATRDAKLLVEGARANAGIYLRRAAEARAKGDREEMSRQLEQGRQVMKDAVLLAPAAAPVALEMDEYADKLSKASDSAAAASIKEAKVRASQSTGRGNVYVDGMNAP